MSEISSAYSSSSRITGLYSQLDTDSIVQDLVKAQQTKVDAKEQEKTREEWYGDALTSVRTLVNDFKSTYLTATGSGSMLTASVYKNFSAEITSGSTSAVSVSATSGALTGSYTIDSVTQLAKNASVTSAGKVSSGDSISDSNTAKLKDLKFAAPLEFDSEGKISFSINGTLFTFGKESTLQDMINTVNADEDAGVTMKYSRLTDAFTITADAGGAESNVTVINISGNAFGLDGAFGIGSGSTILPGYGTKGQNAVLTVEGIPVTRDSNEFTVDGIKYTLKNTTGEAVNFTVSRDVSSIVEKVKAFADAYNKLAEELNGLLSEKDYSGDYKPLTATQEGEMSDKQIETWNEKAKSGLLRNNRSLKSFVSGSKNAFYSALGGTGKTAASIGVASASYYSSDAGKIVVDEAALTKALEENPEKVIAMFTSSAADSKGLIYKMSDSATSYIKNLDASIKASGLTTSKLETRIGDMEDDLDTLTERYYQKFSAMEQALGRLNSQVSLMSSLFAS